MLVEWLSQEAVKIAWPSEIAIPLIKYQERDFGVFDFIYTSNKSLCSPMLCHALYKLEFEDIKRTPGT